MTTEDYVSHEVAKLLKEKGFIIPYDSFRGVYINGVFKRLNPGAAYGFNDGDEIVDVCSLQLAIKWLEEEKKLYVNVWAEPKDAEKNDFRIVYRLQVFDGKTNYGTFEFPSREKACEAGIRFCLENLI